MNNTSDELLNELDFYKVNDEPLIYQKDDGGCITLFRFNSVFKRLEIVEYESYNNDMPQGINIIDYRHIVAIQKVFEEKGWTSL